MMRAVNDLRLVLGTRLDVSEESEPPPDDHPDAETWAVYQHLSHLLAQLLDALRRRSPLSRHHVQQASVASPVSSIESPLELRRELLCGQLVDGQLAHHDVAPHRAIASSTPPSVCPNASLDPHHRQHQCVAVRGRGRELGVRTRVAGAEGGGVSVDVDLDLGLARHLGPLRLERVRTARRRPRSSPSRSRRSRTSDRRRRSRPPRRSRRASRRSPSIATTGSIRPASIENSTIVPNVDRSKASSSSSGDGTDGHPDLVELGPGIEQVTHRQRGPREDAVGPRRRDRTVGRRAEQRHERRPEVVGRREHRGEEVRHLGEVGRRLVLHRRRSRTRTPRARRRRGSAT